ncbi:metallophosphoesterase [Paenarthrobacter sp. NCHU4564]|uniref:metallophosphoesterase n=1 Tax=Paenarthrobacter sp. NCHU4564 TaxID=3451353 RepID=UPI003F9B6DCD
MSATSGRFTVLHLSDVHAIKDDLLYGQVDGLDRLLQVADYAAAAGITPEVVVVTGDLVQRGHPDAYPSLKSALNRLGEAVNAPVFTVLGNHDDVIAARQLPGHGAAHFRVVHVNQYRFILLDSSSGILDPVQLAWLKSVLRRPFGMGTVIALHHAPVPSPMPTLSKTGLRNSQELGDAVEGSDVLLILAGHYHHALFASFGTIPVYVGPSLAYHQVMNAGPDTVSGHDAGMFSLIHLQGATVTAVPVSLGAADHPLFSIPAPFRSA